MRYLRKSLPYIIAGAVLLIIIPLFLPTYRINLAGRWVSLALVALALDLFWGYTGMFSFGHGVFFGLGGYCWAMYLKLETIGPGNLPDFMKWSGISELPMLWKPFQSPVLAILLAFIVPMLLAAVFGYFTFRFRITSYYLGIVTLALASIVHLFITNAQPYTGGSNGISGYQTIFGYSFWNTDVAMGSYFASVFFLAITYIFLRWLINTRFGRVLIAIRDDEERVRLCGFNTMKYKLIVFVLSAGISALAGMLFVIQSTIIVPEVTGVTRSVEMIIPVALGGLGTLYGPVAAAIGLQAVKTYLSEAFPAFWNYFFGMLMIVVIIFFPGGLSGIYPRIRKALSNWTFKREET